MNYIWSIMVIVSFICGIINNQIEETVAAIATGAAAAIETLLSFGGIMCFWCGIMKIMEESGITDTIKRFLNPVIRRLFVNVPDDVARDITMNVTANFLGLGNAATPAGVKAMEGLDRINANFQKPSYEMCMLTVLNTTSVQLIPTTVISLRAAVDAGAKSIIVPVWITSVVSLTVAIMAVKLMWRRK